MNSTKKGDDFENKSYNLIQKAIEEDQFGISPRYSKVFRKKGYYSFLRKKEIIFDLSIEIWPPNSERCSILYIIECKDYLNKSVPVDDLEEFHGKLSQIANMGFYVKGVFISNNGFQSGALEYGKNIGLMMIEVQSDQLSIKFHKTKRVKTIETPEFESYDKNIQSFLLSIFDLNQVQGLQHLNKTQIALFAQDVLNDVDNNILLNRIKPPLPEIITYFERKYDLVFDFTKSLESINGKEILGCYDSQKNTIQIDKSIFGTNRFRFLLAHEIGHFILHRELKINQHAYNNFSDSEYDFSTDKHILNNYKNWIEWQANHFATSLIMPIESFLERFLRKQIEMGISKFGYIYLDEQPINKQDFSKVVNYLAEYFETTRTSIVYRLEGLNLIIYPDSKNLYAEIIKEISELNKT